MSGFPLLFSSLVSKPCVHLFLSHLNSISFYLSVCLKSKILMLINKLNIMFCPGGRSPWQFQDKVSQWMTPPKGKFSATSHPAATNWRTRQSTILAKWFSLMCEGKSKKLKKIDEYKDAQRGTFQLKARTSWASSPRRENGQKIFNKLGLWLVSSRSAEFKKILVFCGLS